MKNNRSDSFEINKSNISTNSDNFFLFGEDPFAYDSVKYISNESSRRLNDYDFNLLKEDAYKDVSDDLFKLEYKISKVEEDLKNIDVQIQLALDINDELMLDELYKRKDALNEDYEALIAIYNDKSVSAKLTDSFTNLLSDNVKSNLNNLKKNFNIFTDSIIEKLPKSLSTIFELKKTLQKLEHINKSVDELMSMNIPYGENINKYDQLSKYIIKANSIQSEITRYIKK